MTVHGKTNVNDLSLERKIQRTANERWTNGAKFSTNYSNVSSIWTENCERSKAKIHTVFWTTFCERSNERPCFRSKLLCLASSNCNNYKNDFTASICMRANLHVVVAQGLKTLYSNNCSPKTDVAAGQQLRYGWERARPIIGIYPCSRL